QAVGAVRRDGWVVVGVDAHAHLGGHVGELPGHPAHQGDRVGVVGHHADAIDLSGQRRVPGGAVDGGVGGDPGGPVHAPAAHLVGPVVHVDVEVQVGGVRVDPGAHLGDRLEEALVQLAAACGVEGGGLASGELHGLDVEVQA